MTNSDNKEQVELERYKARLKFRQVIWVSGFAATVIAAAPSAFQWATSGLEETRKNREFHDKYVEDFIEKAVNADIELECV